MSKKIKIISTTFLALALGITILVHNSVSVSADAKNIRLDGLTRYTTAVATSKEGWPSGSNVVVIVSGSNFPDALSSAPLAKKHNAPILLSSNEGLTEEVLGEVSRLNVEKAYIVGGTLAVPSNVDSQLKQKGISIKRLSGYDRYQTAVEVAKEIGTSNGIVLASGVSFADALSIAPIAAKNQMPILLTRSDEFSEYNKRFINSSSISKTVVVGGTTVIPNSIMNNYPSSIRLAGDNRYQTNVRILDYYASSLNMNSIFLASGSNFPDGLVGAPIAALYSAPVILLDQYDNTALLNRIDGLDCEKVYTLGGTSAISESIVSSVIECVSKFRVINIE